MSEPYLSACENELLHLSGAILAHGTLLVIDASGMIGHVGANVGDWLGGSAQSWLGRPLPEALAVPLQKLGPQPGSRLTVTGQRNPFQGANKASFDLLASRGGDMKITLELVECSSVESVHGRHPGYLSAKLHDAAAVAAEQDDLVAEIARLTGFQRVMLYSFREDGDGEVMAESRSGDVFGSYLGLRFPASDIPAIARNLYLKNPWRLIPDALSEPVALIGLTASPPDLTYSDLRSVSPVHRVYLANMGVRASLSFPVMAVGVLTALVACHHSSPLQPSVAMLLQASQRVRSHAMAMTDFQSRKRMRLVDGLVSRFNPALDILQRHGDTASAWPELAVWLMQEFQADGATLCLGGIHVSAGRTFEPDALVAFDQWFKSRPSESIWLCDSLRLQSLDMPLSEVAGVMAIRFKSDLGIEVRVYLTRLEYIHDVAWGGMPEKPVEFHDGSLGIAPRRSFEKWMEKRLGYCRSWDNETRLLAFKLRELLLREVRY
jgi:chemotaxis family two-component system sensor kinase Cph1